MKIPQSLKNLVENSLLILFDNEGNILDIAFSIPNNSFRTLFKFIADILEVRKNVRHFFAIPETFSFQAAPAYDASGIEAPFFGNRQNLLTFAGEQEEFYSLFPLSYGRFYRFDDNSGLASVRLASFYLKILPDIHQHAILCIDSESHIVAFNRRFQFLLGNKTPLPEKLLNRSLADFLSPSLQEIQSEAALRQPLPAMSTMTCLLEYGLANEPLSNSPVKEIRTGQGFQLGAPEDFKYWTLPPLVHWMRDDLCLEMEIAEDGSTLPCVVFGGTGKKGDLLDQEGYFLGPDPGLHNFVIKKWGQEIYGYPVKTSDFQGGTYCFYRIGNIFSVTRNGSPLFAFLDPDPLLRQETSVSLYFRAGRTPLLRRIALYRRAAETQGTRQNLFTGLLGGPSHFLVTYMDGFTYAPDGNHYSVLRLQDLTALRERMDALQSDYMALLQKEQEMKMLLQEYREEEGAFIGSGRMVDLIRDQAEKVARSQATTLITGPTGTGKEVLARFIHNRSSVADKPFVKVDCSNLPSTLMESLLFGHEKGAFTGATLRKEGYFQQADKGTLFLDEIHNLGFDIQAKLLQFLQDRTIVLVGGQKSIKLNLRIIVASNVSLEDMVARGLFRQDLYYRIAVVVLKLPPLKERLDDIPVLTRHFLDLFNQRYHRTIKGFTSEAYQKLYAYPWPGNIRELRNVIERAGLFCSSAEIGPSLITFPEAGTATPLPAPSIPPTTRKPLNSIRLSKEEVEALIRRQNGVVKRVAAELNVTRRTLYNFFEKHGIKPKTLRL